MKKSVLLNFLIIIIVFFNTSCLFSQSKFQLGFSISPSYNFNNYYSFDSFNKHQLVVALGLNFEYKVNKSWSIVFRPNYYNKQFSDKCIDTISTVRTTYSSINPYFVSEKNCYFETTNTHSFIEFIFHVKYQFSQNKKDKFKSFLLIGNAIIYKFKREDLVLDKRTNKISNYDRYPAQFISLFSPFIGVGCYLNLNKRTSFFSEINLKTVNPIFTNYNLGLNLGLNYAL